MASLNSVTLEELNSTMKYALKYESALILLGNTVRVLSEYSHYGRVTLGYPAG